MALWLAVELCKAHTELTCSRRASFQSRGCCGTAQELCKKTRLATKHALAGCPVAELLVLNQLPRVAVWALFWSTGRASQDQTLGSGFRLASMPSPQPKPATATPLSFCRT